MVDMVSALGPASDPGGDGSTPNAWNRPAVAWGTNGEAAGRGVWTMLGRSAANARGVESARKEAERRAKVVTMNGYARRGTIMDLETDPGQEAIDRPTNDRPTERPCLCCNKIFSSAGWANRLCNDCKRRDGRPYF